MKYTLGLKGLPFEPHPKQIIYVENEYNVEVNNFITSHYKWICEHFADRGYDFCYLPNITDKFNEFVCDYYVLDNCRIPKNLLDSDFILRYMAHPQNRQNIQPSLLYYSEWATLQYGEEVALRGITIDDIKQHDFDLADILLEIEEDQRGPISEIRFSYAEKRPDEIEGNEKVDINSDISFYAPDPVPYLEEQFDEETQQLLWDVKERINTLKQKGVALYVLEELLRGPINLSRLVITSDYSIYLSDYNRRVEIRMTPLVKAVYLLFLRHEEGIPFKHLPDYYDELLKIYIEIKGGWLNDDMKKSVMYATSPFNNSINEKCARIREAFIEHYDEKLIEQYIVRGKRGEPKRITISRDLVEWK